MAVDPLALGRIADKVVLVTAHRGESQAVLGEQRPNALGIAGASHAPSYPDQTQRLPDPFANRLLA